MVSRLLSLPTDIDEPGDSTRVTDHFSTDPNKSAKSSVLVKCGTPYAGFKQRTFFPVLICSPQSPVSTWRSSYFNDSHRLGCRNTREKS